MYSSTKLKSFTLLKLHKKYVKNTPKDSIVEEKTIVFCCLPAEVKKSGKFYGSEVNIKTRVLKHIYDKRPAQFYDLLLFKLEKMIKDPDYIYKNKEGKRGSKCLVKKIDCFLYIVILEEDNKNDCCYLVTAFEIDIAYLRSYEMIWSRGGGISHRNTFDTTM